MILLHGNEMHFVRCPDGRVYSRGVATYSWWKEYLRVFEHVIVAARVGRSSDMLPADRLADGRDVTFCDLPDFHGPEQYLLKASEVKAGLRDAIAMADAYLFRVPGTIGYLGAQELMAQERPFGYEVVGDPYDVFSAGSVTHPLRLAFRKWHTRSLRRFCQSAAAVSYVTRNALQKRYPPSGRAFTTNFSDVGLKPGCFVAEPRVYQDSGRAWQLVFVGTLEQLYKAPDVLIDAVARCRSVGVPVELTIAGEGAKRPSLEALASRLKMDSVVRFTGHVADRTALIALLDQSDLFVLPSRAEGLPRAMLEAMARALPCIGSTVNGIPELLPPEDLVSPGDANALGKKIANILSDPNRLKRMSAHNLAKAHEYEQGEMRARKLEFCRYVRNLTEVSVRNRPWWMNRGADNRCI